MGWGLVLLGIHWELSRTAGGGLLLVAMVKGAYFTLFFPSGTVPLSVQTRWERDSGSNVNLSFLLSPMPLCFFLCFIHVP